MSVDCHAVRSCTQALDSELESGFGSRLGMEEEGNRLGTELCPVSTAAVHGVLGPGVGRKLYLPGSGAFSVPTLPGLHRSAAGQASEQTC